MSWLLKLSSAYLFSNIFSNFKEHTYGCEDILNGDELTGRIAIIDRGGCEFGFKALSAEEASNLTIASLTRKVEELSIKNTTLEEEKIALAERVQELEGENAAFQIKTSALEMQFKAINKTRQKAVQRLTTKERPDVSKGMYGTARRLLVRPTD